jgi:hypothetical protein
MPRYHHLYPFSPWGRHGGTLRLRTAVEGSLLEGSATLSWWDRSRLAWRSDVLIEGIGAPDPEPVPLSNQSNIDRLKRHVFPFVLWESGRRPRSASTDLLADESDAIVVLHTTFLAPLAAGLRQSGRRVVVDVHDAIFRGHRDEADGASATLRTLRRMYAASVCRRERRALAQADRLAVAGWDDTRLLGGLGLTQARWAPTGLDAELSGMPQGRRLCVGLLGNFNHNVTARAASELIASPLGRDPSVQIVLAGIGSEQWGQSTRVMSLGPLANIREFYGRVHATVVPVMNGTGMKCKLGEAAIAGKAVITTLLGAAGYPPELRDAFLIVDATESLDRRIVTRAIDRWSPAELRARFEPIVGRDAAARTYAAILRERVGESQ